MLRLTLLCHGATAANRAAAFPADEPLEGAALGAARGLRGTLHAAQSLTSPSLRARQTADALGLSARVEPALRDCDYARWAGLSMQAVLEREPEAFAAFMTDPFARPHGGELIGDLCARIGAWLDTSLQGRGRILAVTHAAIVRAAVLATLSAPLEAFWRIDAPPLSTTEFVSDGRRWVWRPARPPIHDRPSDDLG